MYLSMHVWRQGGGGRRLERWGFEAGVRGWAREVVEMMSVRKGRSGRRESG